MKAQAPSPSRPVPPPSPRPHDSKKARRRFAYTRHVVVIAAVAACVVFGIRYSTRVMQGNQALAQQAAVHQSLADQKQFQEQVKGMIDNADSPAEVESFARDEMNLVKQGDKALVALTPIAEEETRPTPAPPMEEAGATAAQNKPTWQLWWELIAPDR